MPTPNNAFGSTVENVSGSGARGADDSSYVTISTVFCERVGYGIKFEGGTACRKSRNLGFWLSFWSLLGQRPKVTRAGARNSLGRTESSAPTDRYGKRCVGEGFYPSHPVSADAFRDRRAG